MSDATAELVTVAAAYAAAVRAKDVAALMAIYDPDVFVFDMWDRWSLQGRTELEQMARAWFASLGQEQVAVTFTPLWSRIMGDTGSFCTTVRYAGLSAQGKELRHLDNRLTWTLTRQAGPWQVVHEHSSAPASFATMQVILTAP